MNRGPPVLLYFNDQILHTSELVLIGRKSQWSRYPKSHNLFISLCTYTMLKKSPKQGVRESVAVFAGDPCGKKKWQFIITYEKQKLALEDISLNTCWMFCGLTCCTISETDDCRRNYWDIHNRYQEGE